MLGRKPGGKCCLQSQVNLAGRCELWVRMEQIHEGVRDPGRFLQQCIPRPLDAKWVGVGGMELEGLGT